MEDELSTKILELNAYLKGFEPIKYENEHIFGVWHGISVSLLILKGEDPDNFKPDFPDKWDFQKREEPIGD